MIMRILGFLFLALVTFVLVANYKGLLKFGQASRAEMRRVTFPSVERATEQTYMVLVSLLVFALLFGFVDGVLVRVISRLF